MPFPSSYYPNQLKPPNRSFLLFDTSKTPHKSYPTTMWLCLQTQKCAFQNCIPPIRGKCHSPHAHHGGYFSGSSARILHPHNTIYPTIVRIPGMMLIFQEFPSVVRTFCVADIVMLSSSYRGTAFPRDCLIMEW